MSVQIDVNELRSEIKTKYAEVVDTPDGDFHFHTGRMLAAHIGYDTTKVDAMPDAAVESFAGIASPFALRDLVPGEKVVDLGSGAGFDCFLAAADVGPTGQVIGVDMTEEMLEKSTATAADMGVENVDFREGFLEDLPVEDGWADVVIANGVINLCPSKQAAFDEAFRILRPGGVIQFGDIANGAAVPEEARAEIDLWTGWIAGGLPCAGWKDILEQTGFVDVEISDPIDTFLGAGGEANARSFKVYGYSFLARKPE